MSLFLFQSSTPLSPQSSNPPSSTPSTMNIIQMINAIKTSSSGATSPPIKLVYYNTCLFYLFIAIVKMQVDFYFENLQTPNRLVNKSLLLKYIKYNCICKIQINVFLICNLQCMIIASKRSVFL